MPRNKSMGRLLELYRTLENARKTEMAVATNNVLGTEAEIGQRRCEAQQANVAFCDALQVGDELEAAISSVHTQMLRTRLSGLSRLLVEQRQKGEAARLRYLDSLQWKERMEGLVDAMNKRLAMEHERKEQTAADDRHLSQRRRSSSRSASAGAG